MCVCGGVGVCTVLLLCVLWSSPLRCRLWQYYFLSRVTALQHHLSASYTLDGQPVHVHYTGEDASSLSRQATVVRGPCCQWGAPPPGAATRSAEPGVQTELTAAVCKHVTDTVVRCRWCIQRRAVRRAGVHGSPWCACARVCPCAWRWRYVGRRGGLDGGVPGPIP